MTYTCTSSIIQDATNPVTIHIPAHISDRTNRDVRYVRILTGPAGPAYIFLFPMNIGATFTRLTMIRIEGHTTLSYISPNNLAQLPYLEVFESHSNGFTSLPSDLFVNNPSLRIVEFMGPASANPTETNSLNQIGENLLGGLSNLTEVSFLRHYCINQSATSQAEVAALNLVLHVLCPTRETTNNFATS